MCSDVALTKFGTLVEKIKSSNHSDNLEDSLAIIIIDIIHQTGQVSNEIIEQYNTIMEECNTDSEFKKNNETLDLNLQILDYLIANYNFQIDCKLKFFCITFQMFLRLQSIQPGILTVEEIIRYTATSTKINDVPTFIRLKTNLLQLLVQKNDEIQMYTKDIVNSYNHESEIYLLLLKEKSNVFIYDLLAMVFIKLSVVTKTVYRLTFLVIATIYSILSSEFKPQLLHKLAKDGTKMFDKSSGLVYRFTAKEFFHLCKMCQQRGITINDLKQLIAKFSLEEDKQHMNIPWSTLTFVDKKNSTDILHSFENMNISEGLLSTVTERPASELLSSKSFISTLEHTINNIDFTNVSVYTSLSKLIVFVANNISYSKYILKLFDIVTLKFKNMKCTESNFSFIQLNLKRMAHSVVALNDTKRVINFLRLFYNFGNNLLKQNSELALTFWELFVYTDMHLAGSAESKLSTKRITTASNLTLTTNDAKTALLIQLMYIKNRLSRISKLLTCNLLLKKEYDSCLKIVTQCLIHDNALLTQILQYTSKDILSVSIYLNVIELVEDSNAPMKEGFISSIVLLLKENLRDTGLFLYFLSHVSTIVHFPISFKSTTLAFSEDSAVFEYQDLVISHLYILQTFSNSIDASEIVLKSYHLLSRWVLQTDTCFSDYEFTVLQTLYEALNYNEIYKYSKMIINIYLKKRRNSLDPDQKKLLQMYLIDAHIKGEFSAKMDIPQLEVIGLSSYNSLDLCLSILEVKIRRDDKLTNDVINAIYLELSQNPVFKIQKQTDKYKAIHLLLMYAKFCKLVGLSNKIDHLNAVVNINRAVAILQSLFKNFLLAGPDVPPLNTNFKSILKMKFSSEMLQCYNSLLRRYSTLGLGKEFDSYLRELDIFIKLQPSINLQYSYNLVLTEFSLFKNAFEDAKKYYSLASRYEKSIFSDCNLCVTIYALAVSENLARRTNDTENVKAISKKLDNFMFNYFNTSNVDHQHSEVIKAWITALKRRYEYPQDGDLDDYKYEFDPMVREIVDYHNYMKEFKVNTFYASSCYPMLNEIIIKTTFNPMTTKLKLCNKGLIENFKECSSNHSTEVTKYTLDMAFSSFLALLKNDNCSKVDEELTQIININDHFKSISLRWDKQFSKLTNKTKCFLPEISTLSDFGFTQMKKINLKSLMPKDWVAISIDYVLPTNSLMIIRFDPRFENPLFINICLDLVGTDNSFGNVAEKLRQIIIKSDNTTMTDVTSKVKTHDEKIEWWNSRKLLDQQLEDTLSIIDSEWFGGFNSIFQAIHVNEHDFRAIKGEVKTLLSEYLTKKNIKLDPCQLENVHDGIYRLFLKINKVNAQKVADLLYFIIMHIYPRFDLGKNELIDLGKHLVRKIDSIKQNNVLSNEDDVKHVVLVPGSRCVNIPWESIPSLRKKSVSRMPSLIQLQDYLIKYKNYIDSGIDACKGFYVINPGGDLKRTEKTLAPKFKHLDGWDGVVGEPPEEMQILNCFNEANLFIYAGHGGGEQYVRSKNIKSRDTIPPSLLLGCSSGTMKGDGYVQPYGTAYNYINGGCPMLLVNLWDVTDKDIDMFTISVLTKWGFFVDYDSFDMFDLTAENRTLPECVAASRDVCKLKYLNGAAPIVYGLPLKLQSM